MGNTVSMMVGYGAEAKTGPSSSSDRSMLAGDAQAATAASDGPMQDQCGLENDGAAWVMCDAPKRKVVCETSPEKQARYRAILETIFAPVHAVAGRLVDFNPDELVEICVEARKYLKSEPVFIEDVEAPITIVGDLHGQLHDLDKIFMFHAVDGKPGYECGRFLFLGNYIQRGRQSIEVLIALFILKILYPANFIILRGNHEFTTVNCNDFVEHLKSRYVMKTAEFLYAIFNTNFCYLSLCAIVGGKAFCVHGGISTSGFTKSSLRNLRKPILQCTDSQLVTDLVWADPAEGLRGTAFNAGRRTSIYFGEEAFALAMDAVDCLIMFRGHSRIDEGAELQWDRCYTIYSCVDTGLKNNMGSIAMLDKNLRVKVHIMQVDPTRHRIGMEMKNEGNEPLQDADDDLPGNIVRMEQ